MTPLSHYRPVLDEEMGTGHWEDGIGYEGGKLKPTRLWVRHCHYHPYIELRGTKPCERCAAEVPIEATENPNG